MNIRRRCDFFMVHEEPDTIRQLSVCEDVAYMTTLNLPNSTSVVKSADCPGKNVNVFF